MGKITEMGSETQMAIGPGRNRQKEFVEEECSANLSNLMGQARIRNAD